MFMFDRNYAGVFASGTGRGEDKRPAEARWQRLSANFKAEWRKAG
jgi:hypothetical protein